MIKLCKPEMEEDYSSIIDRIESLEKKMEKGVMVTASQDARQGIVKQAVELEKVPLPKAIPEDIQQVVRSWKGILSGLTGLSRTYFNKALPSLGPENSLLLVFEDANAYAYIAENRSECQDALRTIIAERLGKEMQVLVKQNESGQPSDTVYPDLRQLINFNIEEEDF